MAPSITIVTAFFDIGRGSWTPENGHTPYFHRTTDSYFEYFNHLSRLDNKMIIFTSKEFKDRIKKIRGEKPTEIVIIDYKNKLNRMKNKVSEIQKSTEFRNKLNKEQSISPEYFSPDYVIVNNLKSYFVTKSISMGLIETDFAAWIDFGYCRNVKILNGLTQWDYSFDREKIHLFTINNNLEVNSLNSVFDKMFNNEAFIIGGAIVGTKDKWNEFSNLVWHCQKLTLQQRIIDDDQGIYIMCYYKNNNLIKLNYLGKNNWFNLFKKYSQKSLLSKLGNFRDKLLSCFSSTSS
ncbi:protein YibB [Pectobacterium aquaticum]|uniref:protein YibB n=1 Tax=Pectobacterium aquaticum TaxID=2204145 RepID=UPI000C7F259E|nr:protein YibB [Pectobacterium aquaticum]PLY38517.1 protein YibB [Pectobacterium carotovorum]RRO00364.1 protein YibB [Pectobacterium aquaticum]